MKHVELIRHDSFLKWWAVKGNLKLMKGNKFVIWIHINLTTVLYNGHHSLWNVWSSVYTELLYITLPISLFSKASFTRRFVNAIPVAEWRVRFWSCIKTNGSVHTAMRAWFRMRFSICESPEPWPLSYFLDKIRCWLSRRGRGIASLTQRDTVAAFFLT
jgi:hypothetical protein